MSRSFKDAVGALWLKMSESGTRFMSGEINIGGVHYPIVIFKNDKGDNDRRPDYRIYPSKARSGEPTPWDDLPESPTRRANEQQEFDDESVPF